MRIALVFLLLMAISAAHETEAKLSVWERLGLPDPVIIIYGAAAISGISIVIALMITHRIGETGKKILFIVIAAPITVATFYMAATTVYLNMVSETGGPVHWHADLEIWACSEEVNLIDPVGLENKVGSPLYHEHNDRRLHIEGVVHEIRTDAALPVFFELIGGKLEGGELTVPTNGGLQTWKDGEMCGNQNGIIQVFQYRVINGEPGKKTDFIYEQRKVTDPQDVVPAPYMDVPPGDCIIIEFAPQKERTDRICETYRIAIEKGEMREVQ